MSEFQEGILVGLAIAGSMVVVVVLVIAMGIVLAGREFEDADE